MANRKTKVETTSDSSNGTKLPVSGSKPCLEHKQKELGYLQWHSDAERRTKAGQKQKQCPKCLYWFWKDELGTS